MSNKNLQEESVDEDSNDSSEESEFEYVLTVVTVLGD